MIEETNGNKVKVKITKGASAGETKEYKQDLVTQVNIIIIIITRPKPAYGRQGLAGS